MGVPDQLDTLKGSIALIGVAINREWPSRVVQSLQSGPSL